MEATQTEGLSIQTLILWPSPCVAVIFRADFKFSFFDHTAISSALLRAGISFGAAARVTMLTSCARDASLYSAPRIFSETGRNEKRERGLRSEGAQARVRISFGKE